MTRSLGRFAFCFIELGERMAYLYADENDLVRGKSRCAGSEPQRVEGFFLRRAIHPL